MIQINETIIQDICRKYPSMSIGNIGKTYGLTERRVRAILSNKGIEITNPHEKTTSVDTYIEDNLKRFPPVPGKKYVAVLKTDPSIKFDDYLNKGGCMTAYVKSHYGIDPPSLYLRKKYFHENGKQWHEQWFNIILEDDAGVETKKCPYCNWETKDIHNKSGMFVTHLMREHGITREEHLKRHPEDRQYLALVNKTLDRKMETNPEKFVVCAICGEKFARLDWRHLAKHGLTKYEYQQKYGKTISANYHEKMSKIATEANEDMKPVFVTTPQKQIAQFVESHGFNCVISERKTLHGKEIDVYVPDGKLGIEYNGNFWHCEGMCNKTPMTHLEKTESAKQAGVRLVQIFEDEYFLHRDIVFSKIEHLLGVQKDIPRVMARKCEIREIPAPVAERFLTQNHIQGFVDSSVHLGAFNGDRLVAVMSFKRGYRGGDKWELTRFASDIGLVCQGVGGKLFKHFVRKYSPTEIKSFADRRWTVNEDDNLYTKIGFRLDGYTKPDYKYYGPKLDRYRRFHKFGFRKQILHRKYGFPLEMTETEMTSRLGLKKIWDCGLIRYVWKPRV